ncbi:hypothetical protein MIND_00449200 [Mycena indigotica]|uniref:Uncharacterized protein n=1 Tax=Mycena indigotica TaxID=2126181 RepID=A0A8H6WBQ3_9AGAR|nr:uncharacterized protein MIND_00449200 [Mycena indigotica]KAF7306579.1 hypothetical protein MIND_00449200 [Mycena indigotica]
MFKAAFLGLFAAFAVASAGVVDVKTRADLPVHHNGDVLTWDYKGEIALENELFGMGVVRSDLPIPASITADGWEGPVILHLFDQMTIPATYPLAFPFFFNGSIYTAQLFKYDTSTLELTQTLVRSTEFMWVNQPGQDI